MRVRVVRTTSLSLNAAPTSSSNGLGGEVGRISCVQGGAVTTTSGPVWWASAFGTIIEGAGAVRVPAGCYDLCTLFKADSVTVLVLYCISSYCEFLSHSVRGCSGLFGLFGGVISAVSSYL